MRRIRNKTAWVASVLFVAPAVAFAVEPIDAATLQRVHDEVQTPFKYGVVLRGDSANQLVDCPNIFRRDGRWFMMYVAITDKVGHETCLAESPETAGNRFNTPRWGAAGFAQNGFRPLVLGERGTPRKSSPAPHAHAPARWAHLSFLHPR